MALFIMLLADTRGSGQTQKARLPLRRAKPGELQTCLHLQAHDQCPAWDRRLVHYESAKPPIMYRRSLKRA